MNRRAFVSTAAAAAAGIALGVRAKTARSADAAATDTHYEVVHTDAEWRKLLTPEQYAVLRQQWTEDAFSSPLDAEKRAGTYSCAGCRLALFSSKTKVDSGTGWPSFYEPLHDAVLTQRDESLGMDRTEVHCRRCGGHLGHVFDDGPPPTGLRYCINGVALAFSPS